jgi:hypothetical protein
MIDKKGNPVPDPDLRDNENVPLEGLPVPWMPDPNPASNPNRTENALTST